MHARYRPPGNGFRPNSVGTVGHHGMPNPEFVNFSYGHGPPMPYPPPPPPPPPPKADIFMEAGRLAAEYLVFEGILPPDVLPGRWKNGGLNNQIGNFQDSRPQNWENQQMPYEGRPSALARIGNVADGFSGRRRFPDGFNPSRPRNSMRGRKRTAPFKGSGLDWGRENGRTGSWSEKSRSSSDIDGEDENACGSNEERQFGQDISGVVAEAVGDESQSKTEDNADNLEPELENTEVHVNTSTKSSSASIKNELIPETDGELSIASGDSKLVNLDPEEMKDAKTNSEMEKQETLEDIEMQQHPLEEGDLISNDGNDSLRLSSFNNMSTEEDASLAHDGSNSGQGPVCDEENQQDYPVPKEGTELLMQEDAAEGSSNGTLVNDLASGTECFGSDTSNLLCDASLENAGDVVPVLEEKERCTSMPASPDRLPMHEEKLGQGLPGFGSCGEMVKARGEKRAIENDDEREITKKPKECSSSMVSNTDEYFHLSSFGEGPSKSDERLSAEKDVTNAVDQQGLVDVALCPKGRDDIDLGLREEKPHSPSSIKIFDHNGLEASTESLDSEPVHGVSSTFVLKSEVIMDIDFPTSNSCSRSNDFDSQSADGKEVAALNVDDYTKEGEDLTISEIKNETVCSSMESFPNYAESTGHLHDIQDGYNLMVSDFLGTDYSNCSPVPGDITSLQTELDLHHSAGILGDDDQIYLSLGEIPISFLGGWEQPPEYGKPF